MIYRLVTILNEGSLLDFGVKLKFMKISGRGRKKLSEI